MQDAATLENWQHSHVFDEGNPLAERNTRWVVWLTAVMMVAEITGQFRLGDVRHVFADGGYSGPKLRRKLEKIGCWTMEIVKRSDKAIGFEVIPRRWVVERTFAWLGRCRRLAKDWEKSILSAESWLLIAHIKLITRRIARH